MIIKAGNINISAINVPGGYVQVIPPPPVLQGAPSNILGIVGTGKWGPVNSPVIGDYATGLNTFGSMGTQANDIITQAFLAALQGANNYRFVRVTDGTDIAAALTLMDVAGSPAIGATLTSFYTGTAGNGLRATITAGTATGAYNLAISMPGQAPELFSNITGAAGAFWSNLISAVNNGQSGIRGPSVIAIASAGAGVAAPNTTATPAATGGVDGSTTITGTTLVGTDGTTRTGMYALRNTGCAVAMLCGGTDATTTWAAQIAFANSEGLEIILAGAAGQSISTAITAKASAAVDDTCFKVLLGDWVYFLDTTNNQTRLVSPQGVCAGIRATLSPEQSILNKPLYGIVATQKTAANQIYSYADLSSLGTARIDVIGAPSPGGGYFSHLQGINGSSNVVTMGDEYTTLTNYLSKSINQNIGIFVGRLQTPDEQGEAHDFIGDWLEGLKGIGMIQSFSVQLDATNNPQNSIVQGFQIANVMVQYFGLVRYFIVNLIGGSSVQTTVKGA